MLISNGSSYDTALLAKLVRYAFRGVPCQHVGVNIIDQPQRATGRPMAGSGNARDGVGERSPFWGVRGITATVNLRIGPAEAYPDDNLVTTFVRQREIKMADHIFRDEDGNHRDGRAAWQYVMGMLHGDEQIIRVNQRTRKIIVGEVERLPYGGRGSPHYEYVDWHEGVVALAAHEARHIWQFLQRRKEWERRRGGARKLARTPLSEIDAEKHAVRVLECFRRDREQVLQTRVRTAARSHPRRQDVTLYGIARLLSRVPDGD